MRATLDLLQAASRRSRAPGWRGYALATAVSITAVAAVIVSFTAPGAESGRLFFSAPDFAALSPGARDSTELIVSSNTSKVNCDSSALAAPPLDLEEIVISAESSDDNNEVPSNTTQNFLLPPSRHDDSDGTEKSNVDNPEALRLKTAVPIASPPPPPVSPPSPGTSSGTEIPSDARTHSSAGLKGLPLQPMNPISLANTDRQLMYVKNEVAHAPMILDDPDLYSPLFKNISTFKRSYELMERTLKVYVYQDGNKPIFHTPLLKGIYASEGWFMKLLEANKKFVVKDPTKAHLFYLPYSSRQLEVTLYKPDSHNLKPLAIFLKDYVDWISAKYPFWNRTRGADHFLVACHDWGPYTTRLHVELNKNAIKALCNADLTEGFVQGKDVSLPETLVSNPKRPLKDLGGNRVSKRSILAFFAGNMHGRVRPILLNYWSEKDLDMRIYGPLPKYVSRTMSYAQHMKSSKFCICPMGYEVNSPRIVEAIYYECVPVIIADNFVLPFEEVLDWSAFSVVVAEKDIPNLKDILSKISMRRYFTMHENVRRLQKHFLWHHRPVKYDIFHMILHSVWFNRLNQIQVDQ